MKCRNHQDREARVICQKMETGYCRECFETIETCTDPSGYCKFRTQCIIWELCRTRQKEAEDLTPNQDENSQGG